MADNEVKIKVTADTNDAKRKFNELREVGEKISNLGMRMSAALTLPIVGLSALLLKNEQLAKSLEPIKAAFGDVIAKLAQGLIPVVQALTPAFLQIAKVLGDLVAKFNALSVEQKENILKWVAIVAAIGPAITIIGQMVGFVGTLGSVITTLGGAMGIASGGVWSFVGSLAALAAAIFAVYKLFQMKEFKQLWAIAASNMVGDQYKASVALETYNRLGGNNSDEELGNMIRGLVTAPTTAPAGQTPVIINYNPMISTMDQTQAKKALTPIVQDINRSFVPTR